MNTNGAANAAELHLEALKSKHADLSNYIEREERALASTDFYIRQLKKQRLLLKEEIEAMKRTAAN